MNSYSDVCTLLEEQKVVFEEVEVLSNQMLEASVEQLTMLLEHRGQLLEKAVDIQDRISQAAELDPKLPGVLDCSTDVSKLSPELEPVFKASLRVKAVINRIGRLEGEISARMQEERQAALEELEKLNQSSNLVAGSYRKAVQTGFPQSLFKEIPRDI